MTSRYIVNSNSLATAAQSAVDCSSCVLRRILTILGVIILASIILASIIISLHSGLILALGLICILVLVRNADTEGYRKRSFS